MTTEEILHTNLTNEQILKAYTKDIERETAERMIKGRKLSLEDIAVYVPTMSMKELKELEAEVMQSA